VIAYAVLDLTARIDHPFGDAAFIRREDAEHFIDDVRRDEPELPTYLRIVGRELEAGSLN